MREASILIVDDDADIRGMAAEVLTDEGAEVRLAASVGEALHLIARQSFGVMVCDLRLPDGDGMHVVREFKKRFPAASVVIMTAYPDRETVRISQEFDVNAFLTKPFSVDQLKYTVLGALERCPDACPADGSAAGGTDLGITGVSDYAQKLRRRIRRIAASDLPVLIEGESGSGKEIIAKAIHDNSSRRAQKMIAVNCAAIPQHLEEAEFFGHCRGAFTGALNTREGFIGAAEKSTLFFDEICELSPGAQAKLLRVLDTRQYQRVGETAVRTADIRIISATNRSVRNMVDDGRFREDLFFRITGEVIKTVPLNQRREDIPLLVRQFIDECGDPRCPHQVTAGVMDYLVNRAWPGNIRELKNFVQRLCCHAAGAKRINMAVLETMENEAPADALFPGLRYKELKRRMIHDFETNYFSRLLQKYSGNLSRTAADAGMDRSNLVKKLKELGIRAEDYRMKGG